MVWFVLVLESDVTNKVFYDIKSYENRYWEFLVLLMMVKIFESLLWYRLRG